MVPAKVLNFSVVVNFIRHASRGVMSLCIRVLIDLVSNKTLRILQDLHEPIVLATRIMIDVKILTFGLWPLAFGVRILYSTM